jgi:hypothetical protein
LTGLKEFNLSAADINYHHLHGTRRSLSAQLFETFVSLIGSTKPGNGISAKLTFDERRQYPGRIPVQSGPKDFSSAFDSGRERESRVDS